jgi:hypothetical protein
MKTIYSLTLFFVILILSGCTKPDEELFGTETLTGRVMYQNNITGNGLETVLPNAEVKLSFKDNVGYSTYDAIVTSNQDGYFTFKNLPKQAQYYMYVQATVDNINYSYKGVNTDKMVLTANMDFVKGLALVITDTAEGKIPNLKIGLYGSFLLAQSDTAYQFTTPVSSNNYGIAFFPNLAPGTYYAAAHDSIGNMLFTAYDTVIISNSFERDSLRISIQ